MMYHGKSARGQEKLKVSLQLPSRNSEMELASNIFRGSVLLSGDSCSPQSARELTRIASGAMMLPSPRAPKTPRGKTPRGRTHRSKIGSRQMARLITSEKFVMISGTDKRITEGNHVSAEGFGAVSSKYALHAVDDNDDSDESENEGTENREEQIVAPPSGVRNNDVDLLRLRRACQLDSVLPRDITWAGKFVDDEEAREYLEIELKKDALLSLAKRKALSPLRANDRRPHPPGQQSPTCGSPRRKNTQMRKSSTKILSPLSSLSTHCPQQKDTVGSKLDEITEEPNMLKNAVEGASSLLQTAPMPGVQPSPDLFKRASPHKEKDVQAHNGIECFSGDSEATMILNAKLAQVQAENRTETEEEYPNPLRYVSSSHPVHKIVRKLMNTIRLKAWHAWMCWHSSHMNKKQRIIDQYVMCCAKMKPKRSPFLRNSLRCFLFKPSANKLDLAGSGMSSRDIQTVFCALAGQGAGLKEDHAVNIVEICDEFGDSTLEQLDLSRNNIGADGARALVDILVKCKFFRQQKLKRTPSITTAPTSLGCITTLDLSRNHLGPSSTRHLKTLLTKDGCSIIGLFLAGNNFGDSGCTTIISALNEQDSLKTLDLSENGAATASGTAMGAMLIVNFTLTHLYFSYNSLSGAGARAACQGLAQNNTLETLMLQWNGLGDDKTMEVLGNALMTCSLKILSIAENRIKLKGACILASTLELGTSLEALDLDGNKIGQIGARAILAAVSAASSDSDEFKTIVSTNNCGANIIDKNAFDPGEAAGEYDLNLCQSYDRTVLIKLIRVMLQGKGSFSPIRTGEKVLQYSLWLDGGMQGNIVHNESVDTADWSIVTSRGHTLPITENKDERGQLMPIEGVWARILNKKLESVSLTVKFAYASLRKRAGATDAMELKSYVMLHDGMADPEANRMHCENLINTVLGSDVFLTIEQAQILFNVINDPQDIRFNELGSVRVHFLYKCYHKLVESHRNKELLEWCSAMERKTLEKMLGSVSFAFTPNNPTGFHKLDLSDMPQREIALRLLEIRNDCEPRFQQLRKFYSSARAGGRRETPEDDLDLERCWRNSKYNGSVLRFFPDWRLPYFGILEVDFVEVTKPDPNDHKDGDLTAMKEGEFLKFVEGLLEIDSEDERVSAIRQYSNIGFFYCRQLARLLQLVDMEILKVEIMLIGYARTLDWHGYKQLQLNLSITAKKLLEYRVGYINLFDDIMAVDYYELDLSKASQRWVIQELIHLAAVEPGNNVVECTLEGIDYDIPSGWLKEVPRKGNIAFYYCREQRVIEACFRYGSWNSGADSPWFIREDGTEFGEQSWSVFKPKWLDEFCVQNPAAGPKPCSQPPDTGWVRAYKMRRIKDKMAQKFSDPKKMFQAMDKDGGGSLDRKELAMGLFALEIWLHPKELQALLDTLDQDGGGDIDFEEFEKFWNEYSFEIGV